MRGRLLVALVAGCTAREPEPRVVAPERTEEVEAGPPVAELVVPRRSCRATAAARQVEFARVGAPVTVGERTYAYAWRGRGAEVEVVIVGLAADGELVSTRVPVAYADPTAIGGDAGGLVIVSVPLRGTGTLVRVALAADGTLQPGSPTPLPEVAWGWPGELTSDGARAVLVHSLATPEQTLGATVVHTIDLATRRVIASVQPPAGATVRCEADACTTITVDGATARVVRGAAGREQALSVAITRGCPTFYGIDAAEPVFVAPGEPWRAVVASASGVREAAIDPSLAGEPGCGAALVEFPSRAYPGVIEGTRARALLRWDPRRGVFGAREPLPDPGFDRTVRADHPDGVIEVGWTGWQGMAHSPTDAQGRRRYFEVWSFDGGQVALLRREGGRWTAVDAAPLPVAHAEGEFGDGYTPAVLRHGLHAGVLLASDGGGAEGWYQPYLRPCG